MGFRARILSAFGLLGLLPLFIIGVFGYMVSARLLEGMAGASTRAEVERAARMLDHQKDLESSVSWSSPGTGAVQAETHGTRAPLTRTFLVDRKRERIAPVGVGGPPTASEAALALDAAAEVPASDSGDRIVSMRSTRWAMAYSALPDDRWVLVGLGSLKELTGLWSRARWAYLGFAALVALCTGLALVYLVRPILRTLEDLTDAANLIGDGELAPWLPARGEGEVGRLSLATGAMVDRVERMMKGVEQGARMAMVGQLATHLAHEIRNPLSSIRLNLQSIGRELGEGRIPTDVVEVTDLCLHEIERLDRVASSVLLVGRPPERRPIPHHLHEPLARAASILEGEMARRRISLYVDMLADRDDVFADRESMQSVFLNLLMNAAESIGEHGVIRVRSGTRRDSQGDAWIRIEIEDSGPGVPDQLRDRIFEPFYTTKSDGTGVGLATALEAVNAQGGTLTLAMPAELSSGATFVIELPLHPSDIPALQPGWNHAEPHLDHRG